MVFQRRLFAGTMISAVFVAVLAALLVRTQLLVRTHNKATQTVRRQIVVPFQVVQRNQGKTYALIVVPVFVNGHGPYPFLFDTGCPYCTIAGDIAGHSGVKSQAAGVRAEAFGTSESIREGMAASISVGAASVSNIPVSVQSFSSYRISMDSHFDGIIGYDYMRHFRVTMDFTRKRLILENPD